MSNAEEEEEDSGNAGVSVPDRETVEEVSVGDSLLFRDHKSAYDVMEVRVRAALPVTLDETEPRPWTKEMYLIGPGADREDVPRWLIRYTAATEAELPKCKLRYKRRKGEIDMAGQWTSHGDLESLEIIEEPDLPRYDEENGVYHGRVPTCPKCRSDVMGEPREEADVDGSNLGVGARHRVLAVSCPSCSRTWYERGRKDFEESLNQFTTDSSTGGE